MTADQQDGLALDLAVAALDRIATLARREGKEAISAVEETATMALEWVAALEMAEDGVVIIVEQMFPPN